MAGTAYGHPVPPQRRGWTRAARRRRARLVLAVLAALLTVVGLPGTAFADPDGDTSQSLIETLEAAARGYYDAQAVLNSSLQRQAEITQNLEIAQAALAQVSGAIGRSAAARYKGGSVGLFTGLINVQSSTQALLGGAAVGEFLLRRDDSFIHTYRVLKEESERQQALLDEEVAIYSKQVADLDKQKRDAERALAAVGGLVTAGPAGTAQPAQPADRNADGGFSWESCSLPDGTSPGGCLTPRTYHMLTEAKLAGFGYYVSCWRSGTWGEHPAGRACDFSVFSSGFPPVIADGENKSYGDQLAAWAVGNANALGVLYVIWYRQIWMPGTGWRSYNSYGDPATEHTNHVHISML